MTLLLAKDAMLAIKQAYESGHEGFQGVQLQVEILVREVTLLEGLTPPDTFDGILPLILEIARTIQHVVDANHRHHVRGRSEIPIAEEHLATLLEHHFTVWAIASMFNVSPRTIRRRISQYGLDDELTPSEISGSQLDAITLQFITTHPNSGQRSLDGFLRGVGLRVLRCRLRDSLLRVDPRICSNKGAILYSL